MPCNHDFVLENRIYKCKVCRVERDPEYVVDDRGNITPPS